MTYTAEEIQEINKIPFNNVNLAELDPTKCYIFEVECNSKEDVNRMCFNVKQYISHAMPQLKILIVPVVDGVKTIKVKELKEDK